MGVFFADKVVQCKVGGQVLVDFDFLEILKCFVKQPWHHVEVEHVDLEVVHEEALVFEFLKHVFPNASNVLLGNLP